LTGLAAVRLRLPLWIPWQGIRRQAIGFTRSLTNLTFVIREIWTLVFCSGVIAMFDRQSITQVNPDLRTLRQFGWLCLPVFGGLAASRWSVDGSKLLCWLLLIAGSAAAVAGSLRPQLLRPIFVGWMLLVWPIGWLISHLILCAVFYVVVTPIGLTLRLLGKDSLGLSRRHADSYWQPHKPPADLRRYFRQY